MKGWLVGVALLSASLGWQRGVWACAGCSNPNLPSARTGLTRLEPAEWSASLNLTGTTMHVVHSESCPDIGPICEQRAEPPQQHDQRFYVAELRAVAAVGITRVLGAELQLPLRLVKTTVQFRRLDGTVFTPDYDNIHHRNETLAGVADPWLLGQATELFGKVGVSVRAGVGLPLGSTQENPFERGRQGLSHQHIQFGTGTLYPVTALDVGYAFERARVAAYGQVLVFPFENRHGYQAGNRYSGGLSADYELTRQLRAGLGADLLNEQPERWEGVVQQDGNVGRSDVLVGAMLSYALGDVLASLSFRTPVWQHFIQSGHEHERDPGQLTYPAIVNLAVQTRFGAGAR